MNKQLTNEQRIQQNRQYLGRLINEIQPTAYTLNVKLANNPFLRTQDKFQYIVYHLNQYNKRIQKKEVNDPYEMISYERLHSMVSDLAQNQTRQDQLETLKQVYDWYKDQWKLVQQRKDQGQIRYLMTNGYRKYVKIIDKIDTDKQAKNQHKEDSGQENNTIQIPSELIDRLMQPFRYGNRTSHKQLDIPLRRLNEYKRKVINIAPFIENKETSQPGRVIYPMPSKWQPKQEQEQPKQGQQNLQNKEGAVQQVQPLQQGQQTPQGTQVKPQQNAVEQQQDLGGFGEEPEQPQEQQPPEDTGDKLAPKNKLFTSAVTSIASTQKPYKGQYMFYRGRQNTAQRSLQQRYLKLQQQILSKQRQDKNNIELASERARKKSKMVKQIQKKLEDMMHQPNFKYSLEEQKPPEKLSKEDQLKFGFTTNMRSKPRHSEFDIAANNTTFLPKINDDSFHEKSIRRERIQSLKSKFSKLLNLSQYEQRQTVPSMCQYTGRRRGLSQIIRNHSKSKQRIFQLDQVTRIKQKLTRNKIGVNIKALSQGLCLPPDDMGDSSTTMQTFPPQNMFPNKELPSNPFMVQTKKKKKKKK